MTYEADLDGRCEHRSREPWWSWHWNTLEVKAVNIPYTRIKRWRRGSLFTVYRRESVGDVAWWIYLPFNIGFGFSCPRRRKHEQKKK
jgi:hypothetical protein